MENLGYCHRSSPHNYFSLLSLGHGGGHPVLPDQQRGDGPAEEVLRRTADRQPEPTVDGHDAIHST